MAISLTSAQALANASLRALGLHPAEMDQLITTNAQTELRAYKTARLARDLAGALCGDVVRISWSTSVLDKEAGRLVHHFNGITTAGVHFKALAADLRAPRR